MLSSFSATELDIKVTYETSQTNGISKAQYEMQMKQLLERYANTHFAQALIEAQERGHREGRAIARRMWTQAMIGSLAIVCFFAWMFWL